MTKVIKFFIRGMLFIAPIGVTMLLLMNIFSWFEEKLESTKLEGFTLLLFAFGIFLSITLLGYFGSSLIIQPVITFIERIIGKIPFVSFVYGSIKDLTDAFVGNKKKFDQPVLVDLNEQGSVQKMGFITQESLKEIGLEGKVVVYLPHSYAFSGNMFVVDKKQVTYLDVSSSDYMKFIVSAGVAGYSELNKK